MSTYRPKIGGIVLVLAALVAFGGCADKPASGPEVSRQTTASPETTDTPAPVTQETPTKAADDTKADIAVFCKKYLTDGTWMDDLSDDISSKSESEKAAIKKGATELAAVAPASLKADMDLVRDGYVKVMDGELAMTPGDEMNRVLAAFTRVRMWVGQNCSSS